MKKLITVVALVCATMMAEAASFKWNASGVTGDGVSLSGSAKLYVMVGTVADTAVDKVVSSATMTSGAIANTTFSDEMFVTKTAYSFYYVLENADGVFVSTTKKSTAQATSTPVLAFGSAGTWTPTGDVPEPTSGLLLLLGVAGLSLRRKQA